MHKTMNMTKEYQKLYMNMNTPSENTPDLKKALILSKPMVQVYLFLLQ